MPCALCVKCLLVHYHAGCILFPLGALSPSWLFWNSTTALSQRSRAYAASQTKVLHTKRLNQTESPIFMIVCVLCLQKQSFLSFSLLYCSWCCAVWHIKNLNQTESPIFMILCVLCFQRQSFLTFITLFVLLEAESSHGVRYTKIIADGDSSVFSVLQEKVPFCRKAFQS